MISCKTCGAECQNPTDRYGETFLKWITIHNNYAHRLVMDTEEQKKEILDTIERIALYYKKFHDKYGNRIEGIPKRRFKR